MTQARSEMTRKVAFAEESDDLRRTYETMRSLAIRHVPVVRDGTLVGILSDRDILLHAKAADDGSVVVPEMPVSHAMTRPVITCYESESINSCAEKLLGNKIGALPVVNEKKKLVGILTTSDLLRLLIEKDWDMKRPPPFRWDPVPILEQWRSWRPSIS